MIGATPLTAIFGSRSEPITDADTAKAYVRASCDAHLAVMLIQPMTKEPADMRTPRRRTTDDAAARTAAREAGRSDWERVRAPSGLYLASTDKAVVTKYVDRYFTVHGADTAINLAVEVGRSNLVVVDCDTSAQVSEFLSMCGVPADLPPTVRSPGKFVNGEWLHSDGGHFYFTVDPQNPLPPGVGSTTIGETGIAVLWHNRYVLIPPSVRAEGVYECTGREYPLPTQLEELIRNRCAARAARAAAAREHAGNDELGSRIDAWARNVSWLDILSPAGWVPISAPSPCGCLQLTAPGDHASPRSATAHEAGCGAGLWTNDTNAPLHIWTYNPGEPWETWIREHDGLTTITKFQAIALTEFDGNQARAMDVLGIAPDQVTIEGLDVVGMATEGADPRNLSEDLPVSPPPREISPREEELEGWTHREADHGVTHGIITEEEATVAVSGPTDVLVQEMSLRELAGGSDSDSDFPIVGEIDETSGLYIPTEAGVPQMAPFDHWRDLPPPEFVVGGLIEHGGLTALIGPPNVGKSTVALDMACHIATGRNWQGRPVLKTKVLYLPGEGLRGVVSRLRAWCAARHTTLGSDLILADGTLQLAASVQAWAELREYAARQEIGLIIFDTFARMATNVDENSATDVGKAIKRFDQVRDVTHAGVLVVHHTGKATPEIARGSSALNGAIDSELLITSDNARIEIPHSDQTAKHLHMRVTKQRNAEFDNDEMDLLMVNWNDEAPIITGPNGAIDPMQGEVLLARPVPEPLIETAVRVRLFVDRFPEQGLTRPDIAAGVSPDPYTTGLRSPAARWRLKVAEAIDRSLRWGLLVTPEGTSARYIPGDVDITTARRAAAEEVMIPDAI